MTCDECTSCGPWRRPRVVAPLAAGATLCFISFLGADAQATEGPFWTSIAGILIAAGGLITGIITAVKKPGDLEKELAASKLELAEAKKELAELKAEAKAQRAADWKRIEELEAKVERRNITIEEFARMRHGHGGWHDTDADMSIPPTPPPAPRTTEPTRPTGTEG